MSDTRTRHTPGPYWAERADDYDRQNGRLHMRSIVMAPPMQPGGEPEPVAYVDAEGDVDMILAAPQMLHALQQVRDWWSCHMPLGVWEIVTDAIHKATKGE